VSAHAVSKVPDLRPKRFFLYSSEIEIDEFRGATMADGNRQYPACSDEGQCDLRTGSAYEPFEPPMVVKPVEQDEEHNEHSDKDVLRKECERVAIAAENKSAGDVFGLAERWGAEEDPRERDEMECEEYS
jgi:hypothetical protein